MIEITRQLTGFAKKLATVGDAVELLDWAREQPGMAFAIAARADGSLHMQFEGVTVSTVYPELGQWLVFDGVTAEVIDDEQAQARGYVED